MKDKLALVGLLMLSTCAFAEETKPEKPIWNNTAEGSLLLTSGNTEFLTAGLGLESIYSPDPWLAKVKGSLLLNKDAGVTKAETYTAEARGERKILSELSAFVQGGYLRNIFGGFRNRYGVDGGAKYGLLTGDTHQLSVELGIGGIFEERTDGTNQNFVALKPAIEYKWKFASGAELADVLSAIENLSTTNDFRLSNTISLTTVLTSVLSAKVSFKVDHLNMPVPGKKKTDTATTFALVAKF